MTDRAAVVQSIIGGQRQWAMLEQHALDAPQDWPDASIDCITTSPPYYRKRRYSGIPNSLWLDGWIGQLGWELTPELFVEHLVSVFQGWRRTLKPWATVWINLGSTYSGSGNGPGNLGLSNRDQVTRAGFSGGRQEIPGYPAGDLMDVPGLFARAMQRRGWPWRQDITWCKAAPAPESVEGTRWEQHRRRVGRNAGGGTEICPGCKQCEPAGGLVLRRGSGRATVATERVLMFSTPLNDDWYYYDSYAVREESDVASHNQWSYWLLSGAGVTEQHYAAYPIELPLRTILASTSAGGNCSTCGMPQARVIRRKTAPHHSDPARIEALTARGVGRTMGNLYLKRGSVDGSMEHVGWRRQCQCTSDRIAPPVVVDPFAGSGSTIIAALRANRSAVGYDLSSEYLELARKRITGDAPLFNLEA